MGRKVEELCEMGLLVQNSCNHFYCTIDLIPVDTCSVYDFSVFPLNFCCVSKISKPFWFCVCWAQWIGKSRQSQTTQVM
jgi:hypothetical protein